MNGGSWGSEMDQTGERRPTRVTGLGKSNFERSRRRPSGETRKALVYPFDISEQRQLSP